MGRKRKSSLEKRLKNAKTRAERLEREKQASAKKKAQKAKWNRNRNEKRKMVRQSNTTTNNAPARQPNETNDVRDEEMLDDA